MSVNRAILVGNVGRDPEIRRTQSGDEIASFSLATSETWRDKQTGERREATEWHNVVVFNQNIIKGALPYVKKGGKVSVEGSIKTRKWEKDGVTRFSTEIVIGRFDGRLGLEGSGGGRDDRPADESKPQTAAPAATDDFNDDIPF